MTLYLATGANEVFHTYSTYAAASRSSTMDTTTSTSPPSAAREEWEEPSGRATPLGLRVGGPNMRLPDEYDT
jgi:hypothetical protein